MGIKEGDALTGKLSIHLGEAKCDAESVAMAAMLSVSNYLKLAGQSWLLLVSFVLNLSPWLTLNMPLMASQHLNSSFSAP